MVIIIVWSLRHSSCQCLLKPSAEITHASRPWRAPNHGPTHKSRLAPSVCSCLRHIRSDTQVKSMQGKLHTKRIGFFGNAHSTTLPRAICLLHYLVLFRSLLWKIFIAPAAKAPSSQLSCASPDLRQGTSVEAAVPRSTSQIQNCKPQTSVQAGC